MSKQQLVIQHDLSKLTPEEVAKYLADVSVFIGLDPGLNGLDTIWMKNENGPGQSLVVYARRGTAEILRNILRIEVQSLTNQMINGSIVFTAAGRKPDDNGVVGGRNEIATGSKYITGLVGKALDDAIMTASTRALRRLTMQFTSLGILDESEVQSLVGDTSNPAAGATLANGPMVIPAPTATPNNAPGRVIEMTTIDHATGTVTHEAPAPSGEWADFATTQKAIHAAAAAFLKARDPEADIKPDIQQPPVPITPAVAALTANPESAKEAAKPKRARKQKNTISMEVEPETVLTPAPAFASAAILSGLGLSRTAPPAAPTQAVAAVPPQVLDVAPLCSPAPAPPPPVPVAGTSVSNQGTGDPGFIGKPTDTQMADYRKRVSVYTSELPSSENMGSVQKMRAFITKNTGTAPQYMTTDQWEEMLGWFESFVTKNTTKGLVKYINDSLGVK
jgi:hypothetical protein